MDPGAVLKRQPQVVLVDELAHTNVPGSTHEKRYQDVLELRDAGITVISTLNIQHIESLNDTVQQLTGVPVRETIPDRVVNQADEIELIDMSPRALIRRMKHGNIYPPEQARVTVVDSGTASMALGSLVIHAARLAPEGCTATEVVDAVRTM